MKENQVALTREELIVLLNEKYPKLNCVSAEEFSGEGTKGIWCRGTENGVCARDGYALFNYYAEDFNEVRYVFGVHKEIGDFVEERGWYFEWYDCGTIFIYEV